MRALGLIAATVVVALLAGGAGAVPPRNCGTFRSGGHRYLVVVHGVTCKFGHTWDVRYLRNRSKPRGYHCIKPSGSTNVKVDCIGNSRPRGDKNYRYFYGIRQ
jgi:hypothetical protein